MDSASTSIRVLKHEDVMLNQQKVKVEMDLEFRWGRKRCVGGPNNSVQFYDSFTYDGIEYFLYDCVYMWCNDHTDPYIGKLVKIWETASHKRKVKVVWFFRPIEVKHCLGDVKPSVNEIFLASGEGKGLFNLNPLEAISGKCNVVCTSKDQRNPQPTAEDLSKVDYIFHRTFDVQSCKISNNFTNEIAGIEVKHYFNLRTVQKSTLDTAPKDDSKGSIPSLEEQKNYQNRNSTGASRLGRSTTVEETTLKVPAGNSIRWKNAPIEDGSYARDKKKYSVVSSCVDVADIPALKKRKLQVSSGAGPVSKVYKCKDSFVNSKDPFRENRNLATGIIVNENARSKICQYGQSKVVQGYRPTMEIRKRLNMDSSKWFKLQCWKDRMHEADKKGTLVLLENLDPFYTSTEVEEILSHAFNQQVSAKMIKQTMYSSPNCGKAFVIFKSKDAAHSGISSLQKRCLMLSDKRPIVGRRIQLGDCSNPPKFFGHLTISKHRMQKQHADKRNAVSTSHYSQSNTVEYDMAMEWCGLEERSKLWWKALHEAQAKELEDLRKQIKDHHGQDKR